MEETAPPHGEKETYTDSKNPSRNIRGLVETEIISVTTFFLIFFVFVLTKNYFKTTINEYLLDSTVISTNGNVDFGTFEEPPSSNSF